MKVPGVHDRVGHYVRLASCEEVVAVAVTPGSAVGYFFEEPFPAGFFLIEADVSFVRGEQDSGFGWTGRANGDGFSVESGFGPVTYEKLALQGGEVNGAEEGAFVLLEAENGAEERYAGDEAFGTIDGVD